MFVFKLLKRIELIEFNFYSLNSKVLFINIFSRIFVLFNLSDMFHIIENDLSFTFKVLK
jgi:hypothetical protein